MNDFGSTEKLLPNDANRKYGEKQPNQCRDPLFVILFYLQVAAIGITASVLGGAALAAASKGEGKTSDTIGLLYLVLTVGIFCSGFSYVGLIVAMKFSNSLIQIALTAQLTSSFLLSLVALVLGQVGFAILGLISFAVGVCYACVVWSKIPFAAALLDVAVRGVRANMGISLMSYGLVALAFLYTITWSIAVSGVYYATTCDNASGDCHGKGPSGAVVFALFLAYFWTLQVIQNTVHVSVAGTVGTWWFAPEEARSYCSRAVQDSFYRATTLSAGSICLGSLLVAFIQTLRYFVEQMRRDEDSILTCIADCILSCLESYASYFNRWAYIYVGLYGYNYVTAGRNVMELFQARGWSSVVSFDLVSGAMFMVSLVIGFCCGVIGLIFEQLVPSWFAFMGEGAGTIAFFVSFAIGLLLTSVIMSVIASAVNTVIVCFAEDPAIFEVNHPQLSENLRVAWRSAYSEEFFL